MNTVLQAVITSAVGATGAGAGWVLAVQGDHLTVAGAVGLSDVIGVEVPVDVGTAGFVVATGQPMALAPRRDDVRLREGLLGRLAEVPTSILCVPCSAGDTIVGALELVDKAGGGTFSFDDVELATLLAGIAAVVIEEGSDAVAARSPEEFGSELRRLHESDPSEYGRVARLVEAILARG